MRQDHMRQILPSKLEPLWRGERHSHERIRIAYFSSDFQDHAMPRLLSGLFENHDKTRFEIMAVSFAIDDQSATRKRALGAFERVLEARAKSDRDVAQAIRELEVDIAVDLSGHTHGARPGVLALRPAPLQVSYVGYPATMGVRHIDYIVADPVVIPADEQQYYAEKIAYLPHCYMANDVLGRAPDGDAQSP